MMLIDLPLCFGATGSIAMFYITAETSQGRSAWGAVKMLPVLIGLGAGLAPHLSGAVWSGLNHMSGEFVRTPKKGAAAGRYRMGAKLPILEISLFALCSAAAVASIETGHWFAAPFALLFAWGHGYVAYLVLKEQYSTSAAVVAGQRKALDESPLAKAA